MSILHVPFEENLVNIESLFPFYREKMRGSDVPFLVRLVQRGAYSGFDIVCAGGDIECFPEESAALIGQRFPTLASGYVGSLAVHFFLCGELRLATPNSHFGLHHARIVSLDGTEETLDDLVRQREINDTLLRSGRLRLVNQRMRRTQGFLQAKIRFLADHHHFAIHWYARRTGLAPGIVDQMMRDKVMLSPAEALRLGFVHRIVEL